MSDSQKSNYWFGITLTFSVILCVIGMVAVNIVKVEDLKKQLDESKGIPFPALELPEGVVYETQGESVEILGEKMHFVTFVEGSNLYTRAVSFEIPLPRRFMVSRMKEDGLRAIIRVDQKHE